MYNCIILMKKLEESPALISQGCIDNLRSKYSNMSILQLKKQKLGIVKDLEQINQLLDDLILEQAQDHQIYDVHKQLQKSKKLRKGLEKSLANFEFMLTGDYSVKSNDEIKRLKTEIKIAKEEVNKFTRMLSVPLEKDMQICQHLQREVHEKQKQLQQCKIKNWKKKQKIQQISQQSHKKINNIKQIVKQIEKYGTQCSEEGIIIEKTSQINFEIYHQLLHRREKLLNILQKDQKRFSNQYYKKRSKFCQIQQTSKEIQYFLRQIQKSLSQKNEQLLKVKKRKAAIHETQRNSRVYSYAKKRILSQQNSQIQIMNKQRQIHKASINRIKQKSFDSRVSKNTVRTQLQESEPILPKLYKILGKKKLQIQQDCDIRDLILT